MIIGETIAGERAGGDGAGATSWRRLRKRGGHRLPRDVKAEDGQQMRQGPQVIVLQLLQAHFHEQVSRPSDHHPVGRRRRRSR